jgi:hypothetical protein
MSHMAVGGSDGPKWAEYVEVDGKMQPKPQNMNAGLTITEETLWKAVKKAL